MSKIWLIVTKPGEAACLLDCIDADAHEVSALVVGPRTAAVDASHAVGRGLWIETGAAPAEAYAQSAFEALRDAQPSAVIGYATPGVRAVLGAFAARCGAAVVSNVVAARTELDALTAEHLIVDNRVVETVQLPAPACLLVDTMTFQPQEQGGEGGVTLEKLAAVAGSFCVIEGEELIPATGVESADIVVGVGRGVNTPEKFALAQQLAEALSAELSGSMCGVRDFGFFPEGASYIGLTGVNLNARLYIALGISGSTPHRAGLLNAGTVVCVNTDPKAPFFDHADYGILADVNDAVPALIQAVESAGI